MTPEIGDILAKNFATPFTSVSPIRVVQAFPDKNIYILQNQITGQVESYTSEQLDLYYHYANYKSRGPI